MTNSNRLCFVRISPLFDRFQYSFKLKNQLRASQQQIIQFKHDIDSGKSMESSLEKSKSLCEAQMRALDKKYNGKIKFAVFVWMRFMRFDLF